MLPFLSPAPGQEGVGTVIGLGGLVCPGSHDWGHAIFWDSHVMMECTAVALLEFLETKAFCSH